MPVPTLLTDLSATIASNSPAGSDNVFPDLDGYLRSLSGFLASIRDNSGNGWVSPYLSAANPSYTGTLTGGTGVVNLGSGQFYKSATGDVGIGTSSPSYRLDAAITTSGFPGRFATNSGTAANDAGVLFQTIPSATAATRTAAIYLDANGANASGGDYFYLGMTGSLDAEITNQAAGPIIFKTTGSERMRLDSSGNLGLGVTPSAWTSTYKAFALSSVNSNLSGFWDGTTAITTLATGGAVIGGAWTYTMSGQAVTRYAQSGGGAHQWFTAPSGTAGAAITFTQAMTLTSAGDLLVGSTGGGLQNSYSTNFTQASGYWTVNHASGSPDTRRYFYFGYNGSEIGSITQSGTTAVAYNTSSDYRLKDNPQPLIGSGAFIDALQPKTWDWKADGSRGVGFLAHEAQAVSPRSVVGEKDAVDEDGKPIMQAMEYGSAEFIANIIAELQHLRARVAALEA